MHFALCTSGEQPEKLEFDNFYIIIYNTFSFIRQFVTILSINKTRDLGVMGAGAPFFAAPKE